MFISTRARVAPLTPATATNWMWLLIDADQNPATGWAGYDFIVNRTRDADGKFWLEKNTGGWNWEKVAPVELPWPEMNCNWPSRAPRSV